jgi:putative ABC transport system permease protein
VIRIAVRSLLAHRLRTILTMLAILLGVAMISGTYVLTDQIDKGFKQIFTDAYKGTDVTIVRKTSFTADYAGTSQGMPQTMVDEVRAVDGVAEASGYVAAQAAVAVRGKVVETRGAPTLFFSYAPSEVSATGYVLGSPPSKPGDLGIIQKLATDQKLGVGSPITVITPGGAEQARVSGVFQFGAESSLGGSLIVQPTLHDAQQWFGMQGAYRRST